jgi:hypothetical protein
MNLGVDHAIQRPDPFLVDRDITLGHGADFYGGQGQGGYIRVAGRWPGFPVTTGDQGDTEQTRSQQETGFHDKHRKYPERDSVERADNGFIPAPLARDRDGILT